MKHTIECLAGGYCDCTLKLAHTEGSISAEVPCYGVWEPIETAPKDRLPNGDPAVILLGLPAIGALKHGGRRVYEGCWSYNQGMFASVDGYLVLSAATHWMPLPTAP